MKLFDRWARLLEEAPQEKVHAPFVTELQAAGFLKVRRGRWAHGGDCIVLSAGQCIRAAPQKASLNSPRHVPAATHLLHPPALPLPHPAPPPQGDDMTERFLRIMIQLAVQHCLRSEAAAAAAMPPGAPRPAPLSFIAVDAAVRLFVCLITQHGGGNSLFVKVRADMAGQRGLRLTLTKSE